MNGATGNLKNYEERIVRDRGICGGEPVLGVRVSPCELSWLAWPVEILRKTFLAIFRL